MVNAGRWLRVSTSRQDEETQEPDVDRWCRDRGYEVAKTYRVHGLSAYHGEQEAMIREAMADMKAGRIEVLVAWKSDRLERRGARALMSLIDEAMSYGGRIEFVTEPALNMSSDPIAGPMLQAFYGAVARHESEVKSDRTSMGQAAARAAGSFFAGDIPYGYDSVTLDDGRVTLKPNANAAVVARIYSEVAADVSLFQIARGLMADGVPTPRAKAAWSEAALRTIVRNPIHRGHVQYKGQTYMTVEPSVTQATWQKANQALTARARGRPNRGSGRKSRRLLAPVCGGCGGPLYLYYGKLWRCAGLGPAGNSAQRKGCGNTIKAEVLDAEVIEDFMTDDEPYIETIVVQGTDHSEEIAATQLAIKDLDLDASDYDERHAALIAELRRLRAMPVAEPDRVINIRDEHKTEGDAFREMTDDERRAEVRKWKLTVWPKDSEHPNALVARLRGRRWTLTRA